MEPLQDRLSRFLRRPFEEIYGSILDSLSSFYLPQLKAAGERQHGFLVFLGSHAVIEIVTEKILGRPRNQARQNTRYYLEQFVDGETVDVQFSHVAEDIHALRNTIAHLWFSNRGHRVVMDYQMPEGYKRHGPTLRVNPGVYLDHFLGAFGPEWRMGKIDQLLTEDRALVQKYRFLRDWLELDKSDPIAAEIKGLEVACNADERQQREATIQGLLSARYLLSQVSPT